MDTKTLQLENLNQLWKGKRVRFKNLDIETISAMFVQDAVYSVRGFGLVCAWKEGGNERFGVFSPDKLEAWDRKGEVDFKESGSLKDGDQVMLKSGGPLMVVNHYMPVGPGVHCGWTNEQGEAQSKWFAPESLVVVPKEMLPVFEWADARVKAATESAAASETPKLEVGMKVAHAITGGPAMQVVSISPNAQTVTCQWHDGNGMFDADKLVPIPENLLPVFVWAENLAEDRYRAGQLAGLEQAGRMAGQMRNRVFDILEEVRIQTNNLAANIQRGPYFKDPEKSKPLVAEDPSDPTEHTSGPAGSFSAIHLKVSDTPGGEKRSAIISVEQAIPLLAELYEQGRWR